MTLTPQYNDLGLVPAIAQDSRTGRVLMMAWMNDEAFQQTLDTGKATYFSRSRQALWRKGETSGNTQRVIDVRLDCDRDTVLLQVEQEGPACHTGTLTCFSDQFDGTDFVPAGPPPGHFVRRLSEVLHDRRNESADVSYTARLLSKGIPKISAKITEEAGELNEALASESDERVVSEAADLLYHVLVGFEARGIDTDQVAFELARRFGTSGLAEKASRSA
ncbi:MAG: phosphoribosyl-ATP pyrophosphohydrolase/phosphoribosyl-AMP cyclohydrolase [Myxococcota bacterium]|jgi:phosphoribosyl-ATP pyrophosphohydrolase/phosphoribosyl-AMP cyclohydrolase